MFTEEQQKWLDQRVREIFEERGADTGWSLPQCRSGAMAEITRNPTRSREDLIALPCMCLPVPALRQIEPPAPIPMVKRDP